MQPNDVGPAAETEPPVAHSSAHDAGLIRRFAATLPIVLVTIASLTLLIYAGYGECLRVYTQLRLERIAALGQVLQQTMETFTQTGLPVRQFTGFEGQARALAEVDGAVTAIRVVDAAGKTIFSRPASAASEAPAAGATDLHIPGASVGQAGDRLSLTLPVHDKFSTTAAIVLDIDRAEIRRRVEAPFRPVLWLGLGAAIVFLFAELATAGRVGRLARAAPSVVFVAAFLIVSAGLTVALLNIYSAGVRGKTEALAQSIAQRLSAATELGLQLDSFSGLDDAFQVYRKIDSDIRWVALIDGDKIALHSEPGRIGQPYAVEPDVYEFAVPLAGVSNLRIAVALPVAVVLQATWRSAKNFLALFVACGLIALIFLPASRALTVRGRVGERTRPAALPEGSAAESDRLIAVLKATYFLGVFVDAASMPFLPQWSTTAAVTAGLPAAAGSLPFTISFLCLTAALLPAGRFAEHGSLKRLMVGGLIFTAAGTFAIYAWPSFGTICLGRGLSGIGQALLLVAVQSYGMAVAAPGRRTQAVGIQVYAFSGGLICGGPIGGLLAALLGDAAVFLVGGIVGLATVAYALLCIGDTRHVRPESAVRRSLLLDLGAVLADTGFLKILFLGIVGKFVFAGIAMFAVPLILTQRGYAKEDIGQIMMLYALTILATTVVAARLADRLHGAGPVLAVGSLISGIGVLLLGLVTATGAAPGLLAGAIGRATTLLDSAPVPQLGTLLILVGVVIIGASQGMLAAPAISYVAETRVAQRRGRPGVVAIYRLLERIGHISGPVVVGAVLAAMDGNPLAIGVFGLVAIAAAVIFALVGGGAEAAPAGR
jgi:MFS family permease